MADWTRWNRRPNNAASRARKAEYNSTHYKQTRRAVAALVATGEAVCWRCGKQLIPGNWHLGHDDNDRSIIRGGECAPCNLKAAASKGAQVARANRLARRAAITALRM